MNNEEWARYHNRTFKELAIPALIVLMALLMCSPIAYIRFATDGDKEIILPDITTPQSYGSGLQVIFRTAAYLSGGTIDCYVNGYGIWGGGARFLRTDEGDVIPDNSVAINCYN